MKKKLQIQNLKCEGYECTILKNLTAIDSVKAISINIPNSEIALIVENKSCLEKVRLKRSQIGYPLVGGSNTFTKKATSYVSCAIGKFNTSNQLSKKGC
ncbi:MAG: copper chaperone [Polaribacter sp.]|jgi:copper chaperone